MPSIIHNKWNLLLLFISCHMNMCLHLANRGRMDDIMLAEAANNKQNSVNDITSYQKMKPALFLHRNCRNCIYPQSKIERTHVPDQLVSWATEFVEYRPKHHESPAIEGKPWADPKQGDESFREIKWNQLDGAVSRISFVGEYKIENGVPLNPFGRTGICGRGLLGRWGPNHAADPIVTKWKRDSSNAKTIDENSGQCILQMIAIQRKDNGMWAIPGGMVDPNEKISSTLKREFIEETLRKSNKMTEQVIDVFFNENSTEIYSGYVDDPRNTDNAWMETTACNFHDDSGSILDALTFKAGSDARRVKWLDVDHNLNLYANHKDFVEKVANGLNAHW